MLRQHLDTLTPFWSGVAAFAAGALTLFAFAPFSLFPAAVIGPAMLFLLWLNASPKQAFQQGWSFGLGLLGFGVSWMHISIDQFGNVGTWLAILITLLFIIIIALYFGLVGWVSRRFFSYAKPSLQLVLVFPLLWTLGEWLRGWFLSGFPWLSLGYSQIDSPLAGFAPLLGVYGVSLMVVLSAGLLVTAYGERRINPLIMGLLALVIWADGFLLTSVDWGQPSDDPIQVSLVQGNIAQSEKWQRDNLRPTLALYRDLSRQNWSSEVIVWPETAVPAFQHLVDEAFLKPMQVEAQKHNSALLLGIPVWQDEGKRYFNALLAMDGERDEYAKRHLVPFGEFLPLKSIIGPLLEWVSIPMSDFSAGDQVRPIVKLAGRSVGVSICYEDAFGEEVIEALPEAEYLVNVSNDAWFGDSLAMPQHLEIARMRSLETGRYLLRSTNTGISALIDAKGRVVSRSPKMERHVLTGQIQPMQGTTPYVLFGNWLVVSFCGLSLGIAGLICRHRRCRLS